MATYRRTALRQLNLANNAYINTAVTFYTVNLTTGERTSTLATLYDAPSAGNAVSNPYTLDASGKTAEPLYFETPIIAVINSTELGTHETGIIYPISGAYRGDWAASESYLPGDLVKDAAAGDNTGNLYVSESAHTSTASWTSDRGTYWDLFLDVAAAQDWAELAEEWATKAEDSTVTGGGGEFSAKHYAAKASASASSASSSASTATTQAGAATTQAGIATTQAGIATTQAGTATTQASNAATSAALAEDWAIDNTVSGGSAKEWATRAEDSTIPGGGGEFSAKHYAAKAAASAASIGNNFGVIAVSGQSNIESDSAGDTLNIAAGSGILITTDAGTDTVTITRGAISASDVSSGTFDNARISSGNVTQHIADIKPTESLIIAVSDETSDLETGTAKLTFRMPYAFTVTAVRASVTTAPVGSTIIVDINEGGSSILGTKLSIDDGEKTSTTASSAATITDSALADDAEMTVDIDQVGSGTAGAGLKVVLIGYRT